MRISFIIILFHIAYSEGVHRGCMNEHNSRSYGVRPTLSETYLSPSEHFLIHYNNSDSNEAPIQEDLNPQNGIPDYVEEVGLIADLTRTILIDSMGFRSEIDDEDGKYDIYIVNLGSGFNFAYGWNYIDDNDDIEGTSWVEIDNDYLEDSYYTNGLDAMRATVAHEFFHAIQRAYHERHSGTYIEGGITPVNYSYFYEFSSMWLEDIIAPESNDYLYFLSSASDHRRFFSNPEQKFSDTDGYSTALYGHYLSSIIEGLADETLSTIIRQAWEKFGDELLDPIDALDAVLSQPPYYSSFIESWVDFCSRNFHNGQFPDMNNDIYYYIDQTSPVFNKLGISNGNLHQGNYDSISYEMTTVDTLSSLNNLDGIEIDELDNFSIQMHSIISDSMGFLMMDYSASPSLGKYIIADTNSLDASNAHIEEISLDPILLNSNNVIHFIYAGNNPNLIDISPSASFFPTIPELLSAAATNDGIKIIWKHSLGEGNLKYSVYRDGIEIAYDLSDTMYTDTSIAALTEYEYSISCSNSIGESALSNSILVNSWPEDSDVTNSKIISLYPNPISRPGINNFNLVIDYGTDMSQVKVSIYDIQGQCVSSQDLGTRQQGRFEEYIGNLLYSELSSGIYFIHISFDNSTLKQKFTILK